MATKTIGSGQVGRSVPRLEGQAKVTGRAEYVHNLRLPGMLYGKIFRSTVAHGRIKRVDASAARALAGAAVDDKTLARAGDAAADEAECISDVRGSAAYKRELIRVYVGRAVRQALSSNGATH